MATFGKGQSFKGQRVHVASAFEQKGGKGMNVSFSMSNDTREGEDVFTDPMLSYDTYTDADGKQKNKFTQGYSMKQWEAIEAAGNKDGDKLVVIADVFPNKRGPGLMVNTNSLKTPETPFDQDKHQANTMAAREAKKAAKAADNEAGKENEKEADKELDVS